ncbi:MAG: hypothetical protein R3B95_15980 [Nitrospirales bacterium]|nr:hypothetical protein [Nitrospirales bacterium]
MSDPQPATAEYSALQFVSPAIAYQPRNFSPGSESSPSSRKQIVEELHTLHTHGFQSLVTYSSRGVLGDIPAIARKEGFSGTVIMGIWDIFSEDEWEHALSQQAFVNGYCLGNEGLGIRYTPDELAEKMAKLKEATGKPVSTTEPIDRYLQGPYQEWLLTHSDWLFPLAQPFWAAQFEPQRAVDWIVVRSDYLESISGRNVILKEVGFPTALSRGQTEDDQLAFFQALQPTGLTYFYFEAFDQPWKHHVFREPEFEAHWGLHRADGTPKKVMNWLAARWAR